MKRKLLFMLLIISGSLCSQNIYLKSGINHTSYNFTSASGERIDNIQAELGKAYEIGYKLPLFKDSIFSYDVGLVFNEYNAIVGVPNASIKWKTGYVGLQSSFLYSFLRLNHFSVDAKAGGGINTIMYGKEDVNGIVHDLRDNSDFSGAVFHALVGLQAKLEASEYCHLSIGYNYSNTINKLKNPQKFSFETSQIMFGIHLTIVKKQVVNIKN